MTTGCHQSVQDKDNTTGGIRILLLGNPNVGKSVVFSQLTGKYVTVSNYPGTTVEVASSKANWDGNYTVIDTPGTNSLIPRSEDERIARDMLLEGGDSVIIQVADAKNLKRALLISSQLAETELPFVLALNMWDEAQQKGIEVDIRQLSQLLGVSVVPTIAVANKGLDELKRNIPSATKATFRIKYEQAIEESISRIESLLPSLPVAGRSVALMLLAGDKTIKEKLAPLLSAETINLTQKIVDELQSRYSKPIGYIITQQRLKQVQRIIEQCSPIGTTTRLSVKEVLGQLSSHPIAGIPILLLVLFLFYLLIGRFAAGTAVNFLESVVFGQWIIPSASKLFALVPIPLFQEIMVGKYGLVTMALTYAIAIIFPIVGFFFLAFSVTEDVGYLPRLAIMTNRVFKAIGLNGRAVLPMILGLGCDTMATITTRTLESKRDRVIATLLLALAVPCSAQLGVIAVMLTGISGKGLAVYTGIIALQFLLVGFLAAKVIPGKSSDFILEMPPIRVPQISNILLKTLARVEWYLKEVVPLFLLGTLILFILDKVGVLTIIERAGAPIVRGWLGLPTETTSAFILGFLRRDFGAAGFFALSQRGLLDPIQVVVSLVTITLFVPCIANFMVIIKERGWRVATAIVGFIFPYAVFSGGIVNLILRSLGVQL